MKATSAPAAGWYQDPSKRHEHRWWNGSEWTPHVITLGLRSIDYGGDPEPTTAAAVEETPEAVDGADAEVEARAWRWPRSVWCTALLGGVLLAVGAVLPWAEASSKGASFSSAGINGNGGATLAAALVIVLLCPVLRPPKLAAGVAIGVSLLAVVVAVHDALDISHKADQLMQRLPTASAGVGIGVWVTLAGAVVALAGAVAGFVVASRHT
jgi:hypothetical protein